MSLKNTKPAVFRPKGLSDTLDGSNNFNGAMSQLVNLIPSPSTDTAWTCRPAAVQMTSYAGFTTPGFISGLLVVGNIAYGTIASGRNAGKDEPFAYNLLTNTFLTVTGITNANSPTSPATTGAWTPPILCVVGNRVIVTHPGFPGGATKFGWFDVSGFSDATKTGTTHTSTLIDALSANVLTAGWQVGMAITGAGIPANTTIVSIAANGLSLILSAATSSGGAGVALTVTGGTAASPQWAAGDCNLNNLAGVPVGVGQMNGRAWYLVGNSIEYSDSLVPCQKTLSSQVLTPNNGLACTAIGPIPLASPIQGGIVQALIVFQNNVAMQQITGDPVTTNLLLNALKVSTGTLAPLSLTPVSNALMFVSPEGLRVIDAAGQVSAPIGDHGTGVTAPFIYSAVPSRITAAANADTVRVTNQNANIGGQPTQEFWFDLTRKCWCGPHTFPADQIEAWGATFVVVATGINAKLWQSDANPTINSSYTENGTVLSWVYQTCLLPDTDMMAENNLSETAVAMSLPSAQVVTVIAADEDGNTLGQAVITAPGGGPSLWGALVWGVGPWGSAAGGFKQWRVPWMAPIVFKQMSVRLTGNSGGLTLGNLYLKYQILGYMLQAS